MEKENQRLKTELQSKETELQAIKMQKVSELRAVVDNSGMFVGGGRREDS